MTDKRRSETDDGRGISEVASIIVGDGSWGVKSILESYFWEREAGMTINISLSSWSAMEEDKGTLPPSIHAFTDSWRCHSKYFLSMISPTPTAIKERQSDSNSRRFILHTSRRDDIFASRWRNMRTYLIPIQDITDWLIYGNHYRISAGTSQPNILLILQGRKDTTFVRVPTIRN